MPAYVTLLAALLIALGQLPARSAEGVDLHAFWDGRCAQCHGHAGAFAREHLGLSDGQLTGKHHKTDLKRFLGQHEMGPAQVEGIYGMLLAQVQTAPLYQQKCARCHGTAADFARQALTLRDGIAVGVETKKPVLEFLGSHGRVTADEARAIAESLTRVLQETGTSPAPK